MFYTDHMASIGIRELNQQTSQVLDRVRAGETIEITDRGVPVAEIRPVTNARAVLARLAAEGRLEDWNRVIAIDLTGVWSCMRYQIPQIFQTHRAMEPAIKDYQRK